MQVYISSTYDALMEEHEFIKQIILNTNHIPTDLNYSQNWMTAKNMGLMSHVIEESDIIILILGGKDGPPLFMNTSQLNIEYYLARKLKKPIFVFKISDTILKAKVDSGLFTSEEVYETKNRERFRGFIHSVSTENTVLNINNQDELKTHVMRSLLDATTHLGLEGWVRAEKHPLLQEVERLQRELENLASKQEILAKETVRPSPESRLNKLGAFTYEEILYALTSRSIEINESVAVEFGLTTRNPTLLELLMEHHFLLSKGIPNVTNNSLDEILRVHLVPVLLSLGMMEDSHQMIGDIPFDKSKLNVNGLTLVGKIYAGVFEEINF